MEKLEDHILIAGLKRNDAGAWRSVYDRHYVVLCKIAYSYVGDRFWAESIVDGVIFHMWEIRSTLSIHTSLRQYLVKAVRNRCINHLQSEKSRCVSCFSSLPEGYMDASVRNAADGPRPLDTLLGKELEKEVENAVAAIPEDSRRVFMKSRFENMKYEEIASELGISVNTVKYHIKKALSVLRDRLSRYMVFLAALFIGN